MEVRGYTQAPAALHHGIQRPLTLGQMLGERQCRLDSLERRRNSHNHNLSKIKVSPNPNGGKISSYVPYGSGN